MSYQLPSANAYFRVIPYEMPINGTIGPHEGREAELMLAGSKHIAHLDYIPAELQAHIDNGTFKTLIHQMEIEGIKACSYTIYRSGHEKDAEYFHEIMTNPEHFWRDWEENVRETGRLLGYKAEDIQAMVDMRKWREQINKETWRPLFGAGAWNAVLDWSYPSKVKPFSCLEGKRKMEAKAAATAA